MRKYLIVGGVAGGAGVAARLRRLDEKASITIYERGDYVSYANCGLPYYAGNVITERSRLFIMTPEKFMAVAKVRARVGHEVVSINREARSIRVRNVKTGEEFDDTYDTLILSPGAAPIRPRVPGIDDPAIWTLRNVADIDAIKAHMSNLVSKEAVVVGGGFIGLEMAENLHEAGFNVTIVEALDQVMNVADYDMAAIVQGHLREKGIKLWLKDAVASFEREENQLFVRLSSGASIPADIVILSIGVRPDTGIADAAGLTLAANGAIRVDEYFTTSDPNIRAVGDAIEFKSPLLGVPQCVPLAGPANKQARICADNIALGDVTQYHGTVSTAAAKVFDLTVAATGLGEKQLIKAGRPFAVAITHATNHAGYYPDAHQLCLKILYDPETGALWGAQCVGYGGVDKRIDVISAYLKKAGTVEDLAEFEQAYAPPYSSAKDPINMVGFIAQNAQAGNSQTLTVEDVPAWVARGACLLDVRTPDEFRLGAIPGALNIPHTELRDRLAEVPKGKPVLIYCAVGLRGYIAERILRQNGFSDVGNLSGGYKTWLAETEERRLLEERPTVGLKPGVKTPSLGAVKEARAPMGLKDLSLDACGLQCPGPIIKLKQSIEGLEPGGRITILASDPGFARDVKSWCALTGNELISLDAENGKIAAVIKKGLPEAQEKGKAAGEVAPRKDEGATFIVFSNDLDKVLATFVLANGAAAVGKKVTMFFTFWGLSAIKKPKPGWTEKDFMGRVFGALLPKHMGKLGLSRMNFLGMGPLMMKARMKSKNVDQLEEMFVQAKQAGVRFIACQMSMDIMGVKAEELLDGVEIGGVATYMEAASSSGVNLFT
jgi:NADPH-dependent 2,4-dienoyl-CoA reductase/sulfur reductase-like enzyme/peroxiredoxin family protein/rhodanese-related sulfurtransferase/TusA-related sulfurtransferase